MEDLGESIKHSIPDGAYDAVVSRADYRCEKCGCKPISGEIHHLHYRTKGHERPEDVMFLCRDCYQAAHMTPNGFVSDPELARRLRARAAEI